MSSKFDPNLTQFISATIGSKTANFSKISLTEDQLSDFRKACLKEPDNETCSITELSESDMEYYSKMFNDISDNELKQTVSALLEVGVNPKIIYDELIKLLPEALDLKKLSDNYGFLLEKINLSAFKIKPTNESYNYNRKN